LSEVVLDASALLALLRDEPGADKVAAALGGARMSSVNFAEVVSHFTHAGMPADQVDATLRPLPVAVIEAGRLQPSQDDCGPQQPRPACHSVIVSVWRWHSETALRH
jgi:PIN domain nuclease of toxin-antitoxin system